jgi:hypothetical protein
LWGAFDGVCYAIGGEQGGYGVVSAEMLSAATGSRGAEDVFETGGVCEVYTEVGGCEESLAKALALFFFSLIGGLDGSL